MNSYVKVYRKSTTDRKYCKPSLIRKLSSDCLQAMHRPLFAIKNKQRQILAHRNRTYRINPGAGPCDVFINHRGADTKKTFSSLLYDNLSWLNLRPFLDNRTMKPGDNLFDKINSAIRSCKVAAVVFSPNYCESYFCLHELALIMESKKRVIPIFVDVKPSELDIVENERATAEEMQKFKWALEEARHTVGLTFDSANGNWSDVVKSASESVVASLIEVEEEEHRQSRRMKSIVPSNQSLLLDG